MITIERPDYTPAYDVEYIDDGVHKQEMIYSMSPMEAISEVYKRRGPRIQIIGTPQYHVGSNLNFFLWKRLQEKAGIEVDLPYGIYTEKPFNIKNI